MPLSALELGLETEATAAVKQEPETVSTPALLNVRVRTSGFCMCTLVKCHKRRGTVTCQLAIISVLCILSL